MKGNWFVRFLEINAIIFIIAFLLLILFAVLDSFFPGAFIPPETYQQQVITIIIVVLLLYPLSPLFFMSIISLFCFVQEKWGNALGKKIAVYLEKNKRKMVLSATILCWVFWTAGIVIFYF